MLEMKMTTDLQTALPAEIGFNFEELKAGLTEQLHYYNTLVVTEDAIKDAKEDLANLRKLREAIETRRKEVKQECMRPYNAFEGQVKELVALIDKPVAAINGQVKTFEEQQRNQKQAEIEALYAELVPEALKEIIPLQRILDPRWLNKGTSAKSIREAIETRVTRTNVDIALIDGTNPQYTAAVRAKYIETLDVGRALDYQDELAATEERFRQQEEARAQRAAQRAAWENQRPQAEERPAMAPQEPVREPMPQPIQSEKLYSLRLEFHITMDQANDLKRFLADRGIQYTKIQGGNNNGN